QGRRTGIGGDLVPVGAEQAMDRQVGDLAANIPQGDVDRADGAQGRRPPARVEAVIEPFPVERVLSHHQRLEVAYERSDIEIDAAERRAEEGMTVDSFIGADGDQTDLAIALGRRVMGAVAHRWDV